jgi:uncharacterized glyoxalase superfamily protein PhnB
MTVDSSSAPADSTAPATPPFTATDLTVSLTAKDLEASVAWYRDVIGFKVVHEMERDGKVFSVSLRGGSVRILLNQDDGGRGWERAKGEGFSLSFTTEKNIDELASRIKARGWALDAEPADKPWGARLFRLRDPDGYKLSISSPWGS